MIDETPLQPAHEADSPRVTATEITGIGRVVAGYSTFDGVRYRIGIVERRGKRGLVGGSIEATPAVIEALHQAGECAIELAGGLGWFALAVTDVARGEVKLLGRPKTVPGLEKAPFSLRL